MFVRFLFFMFDEKEMFVINGFVDLVASKD